MAAKVFFVFCASSLLIQSISTQCIGNALAAEDYALAGGPVGYGPGLAANSLAYGAPYGAYGGLASSCGYNAIAPTSGGGFPITSTSPIAPTGITVISDNAIEGPLSVAGELPFLGAVAFEGALPTAGAGGINYGCGSGSVGIISEGIAPAYGPMGPAALAPGRYGFGAGLAAPAFPAGLGAPGFGAPGFAAPGLAAPGFGAGFAAPGLTAGLAGPGCGYSGLGYGFGPVY